MAITAVLISIAILVLLITWAKLSPFLAFLVASIAAAVMLDIPLEQIPSVIEQGIGGMLGSLAIIISLGAMFGKLVSDSGAAQKIASVLMKASGKRYITWALMMTGFIVGIPLFYNVGFILLVPLVFSVAYQAKLPAVYLGVPLLAALSVTHGFLPPHPSPTAMVPLFNADIGLTLIYGLIVAVPTMCIAGPIFAYTLRNIKSSPLKTFTPASMEESELPSTFNSFATALLPVLMIAGSTLLPRSDSDSSVAGLISLLGNPMIVMLIALGIATYTLGIARNVKIALIMERHANAIKDISVILFIVAGAGALKQVFVTSGVSSDIGALLSEIDINPLILGFVIATLIRVCLGSATVAGLTAAGILSPLVLVTDVDPNLMVLAIGAGSLMFSHVNDSGFWMYKEYFNLSLKDTVLSWSLMETIVGLVGIAGVLILDGLIPAREAVVHVSQESKNTSSYTLLVGTYTGNSKQNEEGLVPYQSQGIYASAYDTADLSFSKPTLAVLSENPSYGVMNRSMDRYYSVGESDIGKIAAFSLSQDTKKLTLINEVPSNGAYPCFIALSPDNSLIAVANYGSGSISIYRVNSDSGAIGEKIASHRYSGSSIDQARQQSPHAHWINWSYDGNTLYVVDLGTDRITRYNSATDWQEGREALALRPGSGPRHLVIHPKKNQLFILNELTNDVVSAHIQSDGSLKEIQRISTLPADYTKHSQAGHIALSIDGRLLYVSNRGHDSLTVFNVNTDGTLEKIQTISSAGKWPRFFVITPDQRRIFVANQHSHSIASFTIDREGKLALERSEKLVTQPSYIQVTGVSSSDE